MQQNKSQGYLTINIQGQKIKCSKKLCLMSTFLNNLSFLGQSKFLNDYDQDQQYQSEHHQQQQQNQSQQIFIQLIPLNIFNKFIQFCQLNNYTQPLIPTPIQTNNLSQILDHKNYQFICQYDYNSDQLNQLFKAANFLGCKGLEKVIAAKFACLIYFQDSKEKFQEKCKELKIQGNVKGKIQFEDQEKFDKLYSFVLGV